MCKNDDRLPHQKSKFFIASKGLGLTLSRFNLKKSLKRVITEYIPNVRFIMSLS